MRLVSFDTDENARTRFAIFSGFVCVLFMLLFLNGDSSCFDMVVYSFIGLSLSCFPFKFNFG